MATPKRSGPKKRKPAAATSDQSSRARSRPAKKSARPRGKPPSRASKTTRNGSGVAATKGNPLIVASDLREEAGLHLHWQGRRSYRSAIPTPRVLQPDEKLSFGDADHG